MTIRTMLLVLATAGLTACDPPEGPNTTGTPAPAKPAAAPAAAPSGPRTISDSGRTAMKDKLANESTGRKAWVLSQPGNPEVATFVASLVSVFKDAGWQVQTDTVTGIMLKPGLVTLIAEEQYPPYVDSVLKALEASGVEAKSASGYRAYYESKKQENPSWPGVPIRADQDFVIVVGPKATS